MTKKHDPKKASIQRILDRVSDANRPTLERYAQVRLINGITASTVYNYLQVLTFLDKFLDGLPFEQVGADHLLQFLTDKREQVSTSTLVSYVRLFKKFFETQRGTLPADMAALLTARDPPPPDKANIISRSHLDAMMGVCALLERSKRHSRVEHNRAFLAMLWDSGFRISELLSLRLRDVSFEDGAVKLSLDPESPDLKTGARTIYVVDCHDPGASRTWTSHAL